MTTADFQPLENRGFTLLETLIALSVAVLIIGAVSAGVGRALLDERRAQARAEAGLFARTLACREALGKAGEKDVMPPPGWRLSRVEQKLGEGATARVWRTWTYAPETDPTLRFHASFPLSFVVPSPGG